VGELPEMGEFRINNSLHYVPLRKNTLRGFAVSVVIVTILLLLFGMMKIDPPKEITKVSTIPLQLLNLGSGDGTGLKSGNLTKEGKSIRGEAQRMNLEDADRSSADLKKKRTPNSTDISESSNIKSVKKLSSVQKKNKNKKGSATRSVGKKKADEDELAMGLGVRGSGKGKGDGFGEIDWGGGGNRIVLNKIVPKFPKSVVTSARIMLQFKVLPDGTVSSVIPLKKADPELEAAAIKALKRWRFSPSPDGEVAMGRIPFVFLVR
jgi:TonB family protein